MWMRGIEKKRARGLAYEKWDGVAGWKRKRKDSGVRGKENSVWCFVCMCELEERRAREKEKESRQRWKKKWKSREKETSRGSNKLGRKERE
jgi:hypothetical protein